MGKTALLMATNVTLGFLELLFRLALSDRQKNAAKKHVDSIRQFFKKEFELAIPGTYATGSYARGTLIRWQRDVDVMATLSVPKYQPGYGSDSSKLLYMVRDNLNGRFGATTVSTKRVAVKLDFTDIVADVVPCFRRSGGGFLMPDGKGGWRRTNPPFHRRFMKEANGRHENRLKSVVRLMKAWNIANGNHLLSIHIELMVERMWRNRTLPSKYSAVVAQSLKAMRSWLALPFPDPWGPGRAVDADLSKTDRETARKLVKEDASRAAEAERYRLEGKSEKAFERWKVIYRDRFPAYR